jgi:hypothetical protein
VINWYYKAHIWQQNKNTNCIAGKHEIPDLLKSYIFAPLYGVSSVGLVRQLTDDRQEVIKREIKGR